MKFIVAKRVLLAFIHIGLLQIDSSQASDRIDVVASQLNSIFQCPERVWPGLKADSFRILFFQGSPERAWLWTARTGKYEEVLPAEYSMLVSDGAYSFLESFRGEKAVAINLDKKAVSSSRSPLISDDATELAFHEGFHFLFQMKQPWAASFVATARNSAVDHVEAVYSRRMLIRLLKTELLEGRGFGRSAYWLARWRKTGEESETMFSDVAEGTAQYIETVGSIIGARGCGISEAELLSGAKDRAVEMVEKAVSPEVRKQFFAEYLRSGYQIEGYEIGILSLLALRERGKLVGVSEFSMGRDFMKEFTAAQSNTEKMVVYRELETAKAGVRAPVDFLLRDVEPIKDEDDLELLSAIREAASI